MYRYVTRCCHIAKKRERRRRRRRGNEEEEEEEGKKKKGTVEEEKGKKKEMGRIRVGGKLEGRWYERNIEYRQILRRREEKKNLVEGKRR